MPGKRKPPPFWDRVDVRGKNECWPWTGLVNHRGYGRAWCPERRKTVLAHRMAWERSYGPIPPGTNICHHCDNPPCCNPKHLFPGSQAENLRDMVAKGRDRSFNSGSLKPGEANRSALLTESQVKRIRASTALHRELAAMYGVSRPTITAIKARRIWRNV
jgi:hypothetical protein